MPHDVIVPNPPNTHGSLSLSSTACNTRYHRDRLGRLGQEHRYRTDVASPLDVLGPARSTSSGIASAGELASCNSFCLICVYGGGGRASRHHPPRRLGTVLRSTVLPYAEIWVHETENPGRQSDSIKTSCKMSPFPRYPQLPFPGFFVGKKKERFVCSDMSSSMTHPLVPAALRVLAFSLWATQLERLEPNSECTDNAYSPSQPGTFVGIMHQEDLEPPTLARVVMPG